jgi:elongation factor P hydroxylase
MSSFTVLCRGKAMSWLVLVVVGYRYFYSQKNHIIDMTSFRLCYNLNKHTSDYDYILGLRLAS